MTSPTLGFWRPSGRISAFFFRSIVFQWTEQKIPEYLASHLGNWAPIATIRWSGTLEVNTVQNNFALAEGPNNDRGGSIGVLCEYFDGGAP